MKLMVIDGNSILNRAFYGIRPLTAKDGTPTNAVYGFLNIFSKYEKEQKPDAVALCFDVSRKTFRNEIYPDYKGTRKGMPDELRVQLPIVKEIMSALGYKICELEGFEADDLIGTLSTAASLGGNECVIVTGDRDSLQLVDGRVTVLIPSTRAGKTETTVYTEQSVAESMSIRPDQVVDLKALMGDSSDNIPGVAGIGQKTATELILQFETLDNLYDNLDSEKIRPAVRAKLSCDREKAYLSKTLATINRQAPIECAAEKFAVGETDKPHAAALFLRLGLMSLMEKFSLSALDAEKVEKESAVPEKKVDYCIRDVLCVPETNEKIYYVLSNGKICAASGDCVYVCSDVKGFLQSNCEKYTYDIKEQYLMAQKEGFEIKNVRFDLKLTAYLLEPTASKYTFEDLRMKYGGATPNSETDGIGKAMQMPYLCEKLASELESQGMTKLLGEIEIPLSETLSAMENEGFSISREGLVRFDGELKEAAQQLSEKIFAEAGCEFNLNSPRQLGEVLFEKLGLTAKKKTKTGYSTNADVLESLKKEHPIVNDILEYRKVSKLKSTYTEGLIGKISEDGRIHTTFLQTETRTGRLSSVEPNLQNIPVRTQLGGRMREFFVAKKGCVLVDADYSQIELRVLAHVAEDEAMKKAFRDGTDIHTATAARIHGLPVSLVTPEIRRSAKAVNFGIVYGIGAYSLSQDIGTSVAEASRLIKSYLENYSGVARYMKQTVIQGEENGYVQTIFGRRRSIPELKSSNKVIHALGERVAMNTPIQSAASDIIKLAMNRVYARLKRDEPDARLILQVHDELIVECPEQRAQSVKELLVSEMQGAVSLSVKLEADAHIGKNWLEAKG